MAAACPNCGCPMTSPEATANPVDMMDDNTPFSGSVYEYGIWKCISLESHSFWWSGTDNSSKEIEYNEYITKKAAESPMRINITKIQVLRFWLFGLFGTLGFQYFAVGRILTGSMRFLWGAFWWFMIILIAFFSSDRDAGVLRVFFLVLLIMPIIDIIKISFGKFRDVFKKNIL